MLARDSKVNKFVTLKPLIPTYYPPRLPPPNTYTPGTYSQYSNVSTPHQVDLLPQPSWGDPDTLICLLSSLHLQKPPHHFLQGPGPTLPQTNTTLLNNPLLPNTQSMTMVSHSKPVWCMLCFLCLYLYNIKYLNWLKKETKKKGNFLHCPTRFWDWELSKCLLKTLGKHMFPVKTLTFGVI